MEELRKRVEQLEAIVQQGNFLSTRDFNERMVSRDRLVAERNGIHLTSTSNPAGCYILTGNSINDAQIKAEYGTTITNGSLYLSSSVTQPVLINVNGTWTLLNIP